MFIRLLQIKDIFTISRMYLSLSKEDRRFFHPFAFRWWIIVPVFALFWLGPVAGKFIRIIFPRAAFLSSVAIDTATHEYAGFAYVQMRKKCSDNKYTATLGIVVSDKYKNKGVGSHLMTRLINRAYENGVDKIVLTVFADNKPAIRLYQKHGFALINTVNNGEFWGGGFYPNHEMELILNKDGDVKNENLSY